MLAPRINLRQIPLDRETGRLLPEPLARQIQGICIGRLDERTLQIAVVDPSLPGLASTVEQASGGRFRAHLVATDPESVQLALDFTYGTSSEGWKSWLDRRAALMTAGAATVMMPAPVAPPVPNPKAAPAPPTATRMGSDEADRLCQQIVNEAVQWKSSAIHLECQLDKLRIRLRQDGLLRTYEEVPRVPLGQSLLKRLKEQLQEGQRLSLRSGDQSYDFEVSSVSGLGGEQMVLRFSRSWPQQLNLDQLGLSAECLAAFKQLIGQPYGVVAVGGPREAGKTTTLYAALKHLTRPERKLLSAERFVEMPLEGCCQVSIDAARGAAATISELLAQDPDVLLVGELEDGETARGAFRAAAEGALVLAGVRVNDAASLFSRLLDWRLTPAQLAQNLLGGCIQRTVRRICSFCQQAVQPGPEQQEMLQRHGFSQWHLRRGTGCPSCQRQGYRGRIGLFEMLRMTLETRTQLAQGLPFEVWGLQARAGLPGLAQDGLAKAVGGLVPLEEIERTCPGL